jgi:hypothetical protein
MKIAAVAADDHAEQGTKAAEEGTAPASVWNRLEGGHRQGGTLNFETGVP